VSTGLAECAAQHAAQSAARQATGPHCIVIGAGTVGASCAWFLQRKGAQVTLIDSRLPGQAASFGNAGCISKTSVFPFSYPGVISKLPGWLLDPNGPVRIRWSQLPRVAPWLYRFWRAGSARRVEQIVAAQVALMEHTVRDFDDILAGTASEHFRVARGAVLLYDRASDFEADGWKYRERDRLGLSWRPLPREELAEMEPHIRLGDGVALFEPLWQHVTDPGGLTRRFADAAVERGATWIHDRVRGVVVRPSGVAVSSDGGRELEAERLVLATGAWSNQLLGQLGLRVPLLPKRGYHTMFASPAIEVSRPVMSASRHVLLTPMREGLRVSGTAEFARLDAPPDYARARALVASARHFAPGLGGSGVSEWMGQRPMMADSLPVLGPVPRHPQILCAFGHGHYGLTQGPTTGRIIASLAFDEDPGIDLTPFAVTRF
jgi:D-amino-acid dehydrogenase